MENDSSTITEDTPFARYAVFISFLAVEIPSIICTLLILIYTACHWQLMITKALHHHVILLLIIVSFFGLTLDLPFIISYYHLDYDYFRTLSFCRWWYWIDYTLLATSLLLTATASIQRHILIFNSHLLRIKRTRWLLHYIPLIICMLYPAIFYFGFIYIYPCDTSYDEESLTCPYLCYSGNIIFYNIDWIINYISPVIIIVLGNGILIGRVIRLRQRTQRNLLHIWRKQKKLTFQLLAFSLIYVLGWVPPLCVSVIKTYFVPDLYEINPQLYYVVELCYFIYPLQSFVCMFALPELTKFIKKNVKRIFPKRTVAPVTPILPLH